MRNICEGERGGGKERGVGCKRGESRIAGAPDSEMEVFSVFILFLFLGGVVPQDLANTLWPLPKTISANGPEFPISRAFTIDSSATSGVLKRGLVRYQEIIAKTLARGDSFVRFGPHDQTASLVKLVVEVAQDNDTLIDNTTDYSYKLTFLAGSHSPDTAFLSAVSPFGAL